MLAIQPLDLLPPCSVTFRDYALAVLRAAQIADPTDPSGYRELMLDCFIKRGVLKEADRKPLMAPAAVFKRPTLDVYHSVDSIAASRGGAYRFLDDNRAKLLIPLNADLIIPEIVRASKPPRDGLPQPEQIIVQYLWREELLLEGSPLRSIRRGADDDAVRRYHGARPERQPDSLGAPAWQRQRRRFEAARSQTRLTVCVGAGASGYHRGADRGGDDRRNDWRRTRPPRTGFASVHRSARRWRDTLRPRAALLAQWRCRSRQYGRPAMADKLLIRLFDVGLGDCIYCRIPKAHTEWPGFSHPDRLRDVEQCTEYLSRPSTLSETLLPSIDGKRHVDLLVVTHEHKGPHDWLWHGSLGRAFFWRDLDERRNGPQSSGSETGKKAS